MASTSQDNTVPLSSPKLTHEDTVLMEASTPKDAMTTIMQQLTELKNEMQTLKRQRVEDQTESESTKRMRSASPVSHPTASVDTDIDELFNSPDVTSPPVVEEESIFDDLGQYFQEKTATGDPLSNKLASITDSSLRGPVDEKKWENLQEKHMRPENVPNLQTPMVEGFIWRQLSKDTKIVDYQRQKAVTQMSACLVPVLKAMEHLQSEEFNKTSIKELLVDTFKMMVHTIGDTNTMRKTSIQKEMLPQFRAICSNTRPSATKLFGENIKEELKAVSEKQITITERFPKQAFLGKRGVGYQRHRLGSPQQRHWSQPQFNKLHGKPPQAAPRPRGLQQPYRVTRKGFKNQYRH